MVNNGPNKEISKVIAITEFIIQIGELPEMKKLWITLKHCRLFHFIRQYLAPYQKKINLVLIAAVIIWMMIYPTRSVSFWLSQDQQGKLALNQDNYAHYFTQDCTVKSIEIIIKRYNQRVSKNQQLLMNVKPQINHFTSVKHLLLTLNLKILENLMWCETTQGEQAKRAKPPDTLEFEECDISYI